MMSRKRKRFIHIGDEKWRYEISNLVEVDWPQSKVPSNISWFKDRPDKQFKYTISKVVYIYHPVFVSRYIAPNLIDMDIQDVYLDGLASKWEWELEMRKIPVTPQKIKDYIVDNRDTILKAMAQDK